MATPRQRRRILSPTERFSESLFGLIMVLTVTGSLSAATGGREDVRTVLLAAVGCNLAWGLVDAVMYLLNTLSEQGRGFLTLRRVREGAPEEGRRLIAAAVPSVVADLIDTGELESLRQRLIAAPEPSTRPGLTRDDLVGALGVFLLVVLSISPVLAPFLLFHDTRTALRVSNAVAIVLLYFSGHFLGRYAGYRPWVMGLSMVAIGVLLVVIVTALGG